MNPCPYSYPCRQFNEYDNINDEPLDVHICEANRRIIIRRSPNDL